MENNNLEINFNILEKQFRSKGPSKKAYVLLSRLIRNKGEKKLKTLLRNHKEKPIYLLEEINNRDNIDYLLQYYSLIFTALVCGYIPDKLPTKLIKEIQAILQNDYVKAYYKEYYPLALPSCLLAFTENKKAKLQTVFSEREQYILFEKFMLLNDDIKNDEQINQFLWFLDDGYTDDITIYDLIGLLENKDKIQEALKNDDDEIIEDAIWGFVKYLNFLSEFSKLLKQAEKYPYVFTVFYHYHGYWFFKIKKRLGDLMINGLKNINQSVDQNAVILFEKRLMDTKSKIVGSKNMNVSIDAIVNDSKKELQEIEKNIQYLVSAQIKLAKLNTMFI